MQYSIHTICTHYQSVTLAAERSMKINSRMGRVLPDVEAYEGPMLRDVLSAIERLGSGRLSPEGFLDETAETFGRARLGTALAREISRARDEKADQVLHRKTHGSRDHTLQLIYVAPGEVHPPHVHHNVISSQVVLHGAIFAREYERVRRLDGRTLMLKALTDGLYVAGDAMQSTEFSRNAHWFAAGDHPAIMLNFNIRGYHQQTFDPPGTLGRRLIDPTGTVEADGTIITTELDPADAYAKFGDRPLSEFPLPTPSLRADAFVRIAL